MATRSFHFSGERKVSKLQIYLIIFLIAAAISSLTRAAARQTAAASDISILEPGQTIVAQLASGETKDYRVSLAAEDYLLIAIEQKEPVIVAQLFDASNSKIDEINNPHSESGRREVFIIAQMGGDYRLALQSNKKEGAAQYQLSIVARRSATAADKDRVAARQLYFAGDRLREQGAAEGLKAANEKYEAALPLWQSAGDQRNEAYTLINIGENYDDLADTKRAMEFFEKALSQLRALHERRGEAHVLIDIGIVYGKAGDALLAIKYFEQALPIFHEIGDLLGEASTLNNLGATYRNIDEKQKAIDNYEKAISIYRAIGDRRREAYPLTNLGLIYNDLGDQQKALRYLNLALPIRRETGDKRGEAYTITDLGWVYEDLGEKEKALDCYNSSLSLVRAVSEPSEETRLLTFIGRLYVSTGEVARGLEYFEQALELSHKRQNYLYDGRLLHNIGHVRYLLGEKDRARDYYQQALKLRHALGDSNGVAATLYELAKTERDAGNLTDAANHMEQALKIIETLRARIASQDLRTSYFATIQDYYQFYIELLMERQKLDPNAGYNAAALQVNESARARSLLDLLAEAGAKIGKDLPPELVEREQSIQQRLNARAERLLTIKSGQHSEEAAAALEREIDDLGIEREQIKTKIRQTSARYAAITQPRALDLKEIQSLLDDDTLLLEYSLGRERSYLWAISATSMQSFELAQQAEIEAAAKRFYQLLTTRDGATRILQMEPAQEQAANVSGDYRQAAAELSKLILSPVADRLGKHRLAIVADGALQYVPFGALKEPAAAEYQPLIIEREIVNLPSASTIEILRRENSERKPAAKSVAILADPVFESDDERLKTSTNKSPQSNSNQSNSNQSNQTSATGDTRIFKHSANNDAVRADAPAKLHIPRLKFTRIEAESIAGIAGPSGYEALDFAASKATINKADLSQYRFVHFATHGYLDSERPELSALLLSMVDEKGNQQDGFLRANEIFNLNLPAELVVLSACETGLGKEIKGEGLVGMTRGFMYAGAARVVVSLWSVNDKATAELMTKFYTHMLKENMRPAAALRAAQIEMIKTEKYRAPFYWAPFILQGDFH